MDLDPLETSRRIGVWPDSVQVLGGTLSPAAAHQWLVWLSSGLRPVERRDEAWLKRDLTWREATGVRRGCLQGPQRDRATLLPSQTMARHRDPLRQARHHLPGRGCSPRGAGLVTTFVRQALGRSPGQTSAPGVSDLRRLMRWAVSIRDATVRDATVRDTNTVCLGYHLRAECSLNPQPATQVQPAADGPRLVSKHRADERPGVLVTPDDGDEAEGELPAPGNAGLTAGSARCSGAAAQGRAPAPATSRPRGRPRPHTARLARCGYPSGS